MLTIAGHGEGKISKEELLAAEKVEISNNNLSIVSFDISIVVKNEKNPDGALVTLASTSSKIDEGIKMFIKKELKSGGKIFIENVHAQKKDGTVIKIVGITLTIE